MRRRGWDRRKLGWPFVYNVKLIMAQDLITYQLLNTETWEMRESVTGDGKGPPKTDLFNVNISPGKLCGGVKLDESFDEHIKKWVDTKDWKAVPEQEKRDWKLSKWENQLKRRFNG